MVRQNSRPKRLTKVRRQRLNRGTPSMNRPVVRPCRGTVHEVPVRAYESQDQTPKDPMAGLDRLATMISTGTTERLPYCQLPPFGA